MLLTNDEYNIINVLEPQSFKLKFCYTCFEEKCSNMLEQNSFFNVLKPLLFEYVFILKRDHTTDF